jgi:hypothetical protein
MHCKHPFQHTSRQKDFVLQIARILDREEAVRRFDLYALLHSSGTPGQDPLINAITAEDNELAATETDPALTWISRIDPAAQIHLQTPRPVRNHFLKGIVSGDARIAFNVTIKADRRRLSTSDVQSLYAIPDFPQVLHLYVTRGGIQVAQPNTLERWLVFDAWYKFRIQLYSTFHASRVMPSQVVQAEPPSNNYLGGNCDAVLINERQSDGTNGAFLTINSSCS